MDIGLVAHVPNDPVFCKIKDKVQRHRQLHHSEVGREMTAVDADLFDQEAADFGRQISERLRRDVSDIAVFTDPLEQRFFLRMWLRSIG